MIIHGYDYLLHFSTGKGYNGVNWLPSLPIKRGRSPMHDVQWKCVLVKDTQGWHQLEGLLLDHRMKATIGM